MSAGIGTAVVPISAFDAERDPDDLQGEERAIAWTRRLIKQLDERAPKIELLRAYRRGDHPIRFATDEWTETFGDEFGKIIDNWCSLVAEAPVERMEVLGFRFGTGRPAGGDPSTGEEDGELERADEAADEIWLDNELDTESIVAHDDAVTTGYSYLLTWPEGGNGEPLISVEDPAHTIVEFDPSNRRIRSAGLKRWRGRDRRWRAQLWTPDATWTLRDGDRGWRVEEEAENKLRVVPILALVNNPDIYGEGHGDFETVLPLQDLINKLFGDMAIASEFAAFPQRVLLDVEVPTDEDDEPIGNLRGGLTRWLTFEATGGEDGEDRSARIVELKAANLSNYTDQIQEIVLHIAAITKTPPTYILGQLVNVSADALKAAESALISRVKRKQRLWGRVWCEAIRLAFLLKDDEERGTNRRASIIWGDPETVSEAQRVDALAKLGSTSIALPQEAIWERIPGATPTLVKRWRLMRDRQAITTGLTLGATPNGVAIEPEQRAA